MAAEARARFPRAVHPANDLPSVVEPESVVDPPLPDPPQPVHASVTVEEVEEVTDSTRRGRRIEFTLDSGWPDDLAAVLSRRGLSGE